MILRTPVRKQMVIILYALPHSSLKTLSYNFNYVGKKKPPTPTTIEVIDLTGDSDDETDEVNEDLKIDPTNPEVTLLVL